MKWFKELLDEAFKGPIGVILLFWVAIFFLFAAIIIASGMGLVK